MSNDTKMSFTYFEVLNLWNFVEANRHPNNPKVVEIIEHQTGIGITKTVLIYDANVVSKAKEGIFKDITDYGTW